MPEVGAFLDDLPSQIILGILVNGATALLSFMVVEAFRSARKSGQGMVSGFAVARGALSQTLRSAFNVASVNPILTLWRGLVWLLFVLGMIVKYLGSVIGLYLLFSFQFASAETATPLAVWVLPGLIVGLALLFKLGRQIIGGIGFLFTLLPMTFVFSFLTINIGYWLLLPCYAFTSIFFQLPLAETYEIWKEGLEYVAVGSIMMNENFVDFITMLTNEGTFAGLSPTIAMLCFLVSGVFALTVIFAALACIYKNEPPKPKKKRPVPAPAKMQHG